MKNLVKTKQSIFDGDDSGFYGFDTLLQVPGGGQVRFENSGTLYLWELDGAKADELMGMIAGAKKSVDFPGDTPAYKQGNLSLFCKVAVEQPSGRNLLIVVAGGELQPARYVLYLCGLFEWPSS